MGRVDLRKMPLEQLWRLQQKIGEKLARKIDAEKAVLDKRLQELKPKSAGNAEQTTKPRRPYPHVFPKYRNPDNPAETWSGRGKQPRWMVAQLKLGKKPDYFLIEPVGSRARRLPK